MIKSKKYIPCTVCGSNNSKFICNTLSYRVIGVKTSIHICRDCGFVFVNPIWSREDYDRVMNMWYPHKFIYDKYQKIELSESPDEELRFVKWKKMEDRIFSYYPNGIKKVLDIGAGQGWCIEYLKRKFPNIEAYVVERWEPCRENIINKYGGKIIGIDIDGKWDQSYKNKFDLIVFRHTLEHIMEPKPVLERLREYLSKDGFAYIVVPSLREITRTLVHDYFRPIHVSYFCKDTLECLLRQVGLVPHVIKEKNEGEVWGLFRKGEKAFMKVDVYNEINGHINDFLKKEKWKSFKKLLFIKLYHFLTRVKLFKIRGFIVKK